MCYNAVSDVTTTSSFKVIDMSKKIFFDDPCNIVKLYESGATVKNLALQFNTSNSVILRLLREYGAKIRPSASKRRVYLPSEEVIELFNSGIGVVGIAKLFNCAPGPVYATLRDAGIESRNRSEQQLARMARTSKEERIRLTEAAHNAMRGRKWTEDELSARSCSEKIREFRGKAARDTEDFVYDNLIQRGITGVRQYPIGRYSCDIFVDPVAVEVIGKSFGRFLGDGKPANRIKYILNSGFHVIYQVVTEEFPCNFDYLIALIKQFSCDPSPLRQYRMIWCAGDAESGGSSNDDNIAFVYPFISRRNLTNGRYESIPREA